MLPIDLQHTESPYRLNTGLSFRQNVRQNVNVINSDNVKVEVQDMGEREKTGKEKCEGTNIFTL